MSAPRFVAACVQMRTGRDPLRNRDDAVAMVREAADGGAHFVQTPEMTGLLERDRASFREKIATQEADPVLAGLRDVARERGLWLQIGSLAVKAGDKAANRAFVIDPEGDVVAAYDKIHLFDVDLANGERWRESNAYAGGDRAVVVQTLWALLGVTICYDLRFPQLYRALAEAGASVLSIPSCFTRQTGEAHWHVLQRARAIENAAFVIAAAQGGKHEDGRETYGHSLIVDPWGRVLAEGGTEPGVILAEIDLAQVAEARQRIPSLQHGRPFRVDVVAPQPRAASA
jgi:predicted amidohydrolase